MTENQNKDITEIESDKDNCILFDPYTPFNCISCRSGFAINTLTNKCELVVQKIEFCEEYISIDKPICIRCKTGYVLDYGININLFNENTVLSKYFILLYFFENFFSKVKIRWICFLFILLNLSINL